MTKTDKIASKLNAAIASGEYAHGSALPSEMELTKIFGVSRVTVRAALKKVGSNGTIRRIHGKGSFVNGAKAGTGRLGTSTVHFVAQAFAPEQQDIVALTLCSEMSNLLAKTGRGLRLCSARTGENCAKMLLDSCGAAGLSGGVIAYSSLMNEEGIDLLKANGVPCITLGRSLAKGCCPYVETDHRMGARLAISHLIEHGHRRIALFAGPMSNFSMAELIRTGYCEALDEAGIAFDKFLAYDVPMWDDAVSFEECGKWLDGKTGCTAFLSVGGIATIGICRKLAERGLRVPDDLAAVMYTDFPWLRPALPVPFTAVYEFLNSLATNMVGLLDDVRTGAAGDDSARIITPGMVRRRSCGCADQ